MTPIEGGCLCGAVRFVARAEPVVMRACWCRVCQYFASGNATVNVAFPSEAVTITGKTTDFPSAADSGNRMHRRFCPTCGVHLFSAAEERPHLLIVRAGTLDDPSRVRIEGEIWTASAPAWARHDPNVPQFAGQPPPPALKKS